MSGSLFFRIVCLLVPLFAQGAAITADFSLREWHGQDGLPNELVSGLVQDSRGYIWVAADISGIVRFNGTRFDVPLAAGIASEIFARSVVRHPTLGVLFSSSDGEVWRLSGDALFRDSQTNQFSKQPIQSWHVQANGALWAGFFDGKIERLYEGCVIEVKLEGLRPGRQSVTFANDEGDGVWIAAGNSLFHWDGGAVKKIDTPWRETELRVGSSKDGKPWIIARDFVGKWDQLKVRNEVKVPEQLGAHYVRMLLEDRDGNLWVATRSQGAYLVTQNTYRPVPSSHRTVTAVLQDKEGNIWLGTAGGGLNRIQVRQFRLFDSRSGLRDDLTLSVCEDAQGQMWFANRDGGVAKVVDNKVEILADRPRWPKANANRITTDRQGHVWFSGGSGLFEIDKTEDVRKIDLGTFSVARAMYAARDGKLWLAGEPGALAWLDKNGLNVLKAGSFPASSVNCFTEDGEGRIIIGTDFGLILRYDGSKFESILPEGSPRLGSVRSVTVEKDGTLWIGAGSGLAVFGGGACNLLSPAQGLPNGALSQVLLDDYGAVWIGTAQGVFRLERSEIMDCLAGRSRLVHAYEFGKNEGVPNISCGDGNRPNCVKSRDGTLWFTTRLGVLAIDPNFARRDLESSVFVDELRIDDVLSQVSSARNIRSDVHKLEVRFSVLNFTAPERTLVRYRLEGFDQEWIDAGTERKIVYPRLSPGAYVLRIVASGAAAEKGAELAITVVPYWWQTRWFRLGVAALLLVSLVLAVRSRSHRRLRQKLERAERESAIDRERSRIARDIHDELGASLTRISLLTQSSSPNVTAESARACLNEIYTTTTEVTRSIDEIVWAVDAKHDNLESLVSYFDSYAQVFLSVAKIRYRLDAPHDFSEVIVGSSIRHHLFLAFKETLNNCVKHANATEVFVRIELNAEWLSIAVSDNGHGIAEGTAPRASGGNGLPNLAARMATVRGEFVMRDNKNSGTEVILKIPIAMLTP